MIYADHAATTPLSEAAWAAMEPYLTEEFANPSAQYRSGLKARRGIELARRKIAGCLGCQPNEIYFTSGGSEGNSWAIWNGALLALENHRGLVTTAIEHHSLLRACSGMEALGVHTAKLSVDRLGRVLPETLEEQLAAHPALVSVQYANNEVGTIQPILELAGLSHRAGALFHTDAVQAVGHIPVDLAGIDLLTASAHKFGGPKGAGFLYARRGLRLRPLIYGGTQEQGIRGGTEAAASIVGMAEALEWSQKQQDGLARRLTGLERDFRQTLLAGYPQAEFHGEEGHKLPGLVSVTLPGMSGEQLVYRMDMAGICLSAGAACDQTGKRKGSHVLAALGVSEEMSGCTVRVSFGSTNGARDGEETARQMLRVLQDASHR